MMRRDPQAVAAYRRILAEQGVKVAGMSDEQVIETIERTVMAALEAGRKVTAWIESMRPAILRTTKAVADLYATIGGAVLAEEASMDLQLRDEVDLDVRLLALFDDEPQP